MGYIVGEFFFRTPATVALYRPALRIRARTSVLYFVMYIIMGMIVGKCCASRRLVDWGGGGCLMCLRQDGAMEPHAVFVCVFVCRACVVFACACRQLRTRY
jgi:hypothetical protein